MSKYIIKNCPSAIHNVVEEREIFYCASAKNEDLECQNCTDCLLKQIVEKCKNYKENCKIEGCCLDERLCLTCFLGGANELGEWILDDLDIQEVE